MSWSKYLLEEIDFQNILVLDTATGGGGTTLQLAKKVSEAGGSGRIISIDLNSETFPWTKKKLGDYAGYVEFVKADLTRIPQIKDNSFDLVVCTATMCALNDRPLKALQGLSGFHRILKQDGRLVIADEYPLPKASKPEEEVQVQRWQTYKAVAELIGEGHYTEIYPEDLEFAARLVGFRDIAWKRFEGGPLSEEAMNEWREIMPPMIQKIRDKQTRKAFSSLVGKTYSMFEERRDIFPPIYVMKMRK